MRYARIPIHYNQYFPNLFERVTVDELDIVHLDYHWPQVAEGEGAQWGEYATGFLKDLKSLHRHLFLEPQFRVITNAGGGDLLGCVEQAAELLCEQGDEQQLLAAVRGANVLAGLEELMLEYELTDMGQGQRLQDLPWPILSAQVQLGGGPLATALSEGARVVVTGGCDPVAPLLAAVVAEQGCSWRDAPLLAALAAADELAPGKTIEIGPARLVQLHQTQQERLEQRLTSLRSRDSWRECADVAYPFSAIALQPTPYEGVAISPPLEAKPMTNWVLCVTCLLGYRVQLWLQVAPGTSESTISAVQTDLLRGSEPTWQLEKFDDEQGEISRVRLVAEHLEREVGEACRAIFAQFLESARSWAVSLSGSPTLQQLTREVRYQIPRDAIAVAVDTRPAHEWR